MVIRRYPQARLGGLFEDLVRLRREMDTLLGESERGRPVVRRAGVYPLVNVTQTPDAYIVRAELPGLQADRIDVSTVGEQLSISGERVIPPEEANVSYHRREREAGRFDRTLTLPGPIDGERVSAKFENGVLTITLPKAEESKPRKVNISG